MILFLEKNVSLLILISILLLSLLAPLIAPFDPHEIHMNNRLSMPTGKHLLGTDSLGRDVFSRILFGGRKSMLLAFGSTLLAMLIGIVVGFFAGYYGGWIDFILTMISNVFLGLPAISIMIAFVGVMGPSMKSLLIAIVINSWVGFSRIVRGEIMATINQHYIESAKNMGASDGWIFLKHLLPNLSDTLIVLFASRVGTVVLSVAAMSYLGLGLQPPEPDWAVMISDARPYFRSHPYLVVAPGLSIVIFVWSVLTLGDGLRDRLDVVGGKDE